MEIARLALLFVHILGFAALLGGLLAQARSSEKLVNAPMRDGAGSAFLAGSVWWVSWRRATRASTTSRSA